jgi:hypothetical protein
VQLGLRHSAEFSVQVPKGLQWYLRFAADATVNTVPDTLEDYIAPCLKRIDRARENQRCASALLATARQDALIHESIVEPVIVFMFEALHLVLGELLNRQKYDDLFHRLTCEGFDSARRFERPDSHDMLVRLLSFDMGASESRQVGLVQRLIEFQLKRYETVAAMRPFQAAQEALSEADELHKKNPSVTLSVAIVGRIRHEQYRVSQVKCSTGESHD